MMSLRLVRFILRPPNSLHKPVVLLHDRFFFLAGSPCSFPMMGFSLHKSDCSVEILSDSRHVRRRYVVLLVPRLSVVPDDGIGRLPWHSERDTR